MRAKTTIVSFLLCVFLVLCFALSAQAVVFYFVQTSPLNAIENGVAEVMGDVSLTVAASPGALGLLQTIRLLLPTLEPLLPTPAPRGLS